MSYVLKNWRSSDDVCIKPYIFSRASPSASNIFDAKLHTMPKTSEAWLQIFRRCLEFRASKSAMMFWRHFPRDERYFRVAKCRYFGPRSVYAFYEFPWASDSSDPLFEKERKRSSFSRMGFSLHYQFLIKPLALYYMTFFSFFFSSSAHFSHNFGCGA